MIQSRTEKNFSLKERKAHFLSLTQYSLGVELKFVECVNFCCWAWLKYAVTLKENPLNVTWLWWAWLKSLLTMIKNLLNVKTILLLEFCTIWLSIREASYKYQRQEPITLVMHQIFNEYIYWSNFSSIRCRHDATSKRKRGINESNESMSHESWVNESDL